MASSSIWLICLFGLLLGHGFTGVEAFDASQPYRTAYHFQPPKNWMNDPNGPMIYKGIYHLFYQYNPDGAIWGDIQWAHSTSEDLINWTPYPIAIYPSITSDINGCWSGSATMLSDGILPANTILPKDGPVILYTGINPEEQQVQNLAMPKNLSDPYLIEWTKLTSQDPLLAPNSQNMIDSSFFRDPTTAWYNNGYWHVIVGSKIDEVGKALLFTSTDFITWTQAEQPLHSAGDGMWECPDFYPVRIGSDEGVNTSATGEGLKYVLKVSLNDNNHDMYTIGAYDLENDVYIPDNGSVESDLGLKYDYGKWYASKTFYDADKNRRVLWGWINESTNATIDVMKGWSGVQAIPRKIWLDPSGKQLIQWPVAELEKLRTNKVDVPQTVLVGGTIVEIPGATAIQADVEIEFEVANLDVVDTLDPSMINNPSLACTQNGASVQGAFGPFGLLVFASKSLEEYTAVYFRIFKYEEKFVVLMCNDLSRSSLYLGYDKSSFGAFVDIDPTQDKISLRTLVDHSIVESFGGGGKACITSRVYPTLTLTEEAYTYAFNNGTESVKISNLTAWSMNEAGTTSVQKEVSFAQPRSWNEYLTLWVSVVSILYALMNL